MVFVRAQAPRPAASPWVDAVVLGVLAALFAGAVTVGRRWTAPLRVEAPIDLSLGALPGYAFLSLARGLLAYLLSLAFTIVYGTAAAHRPRAERVMIPILDILQSIPVLSFLPGLVLGLVSFFPGSNVGLELACVLAIFTGQVWNMTFSYHASLRAIPGDLRDVARLHRLGSCRRLFVLEIPSAMIGLVWNSMMSMAGGWFFLSVVESFRLGGHTYRLPGLGSYMAVAVEAGDRAAMAAAIGAMILMIVAVDRLLWRPVIAWAERFKHEETAAAERPTSAVYDLVRRSRLLARLRGRLRLGDLAANGGTRGGAGAVRSGLLWAAAAALLGIVAFGGHRLARMLWSLDAGDWLLVLRSLGWTALRVLAAVLLGALWAVPVGIAIGRSPRLARVLQPVIQVAASFPAPMLFPLVAPALLGLGVGGNGIAVALMLLGTQWYVLFNVVAGAAAIPHDLREVARVFGLRLPARAVLLYLGGVFPHLVTGLVTAAGGAWNASIVAEVVHHAGGCVAVEGIGSLIAGSFAKGDDAVLAAATVTLATALVLVNRLGWRRLFRLADRRFAMNR